MKKSTMKMIGALIILLVAAIYYYIALPAINIHSADFWGFLLILIVITLIYYVIKKRIPLNELKFYKGPKIIIGVLLAVVAVYLIGSLLSSPIVNAKKYQQLLKVENGEFTKDIQELSFDQIPASSITSI